VNNASIRETSLGGIMLMVPTHRKNALQNRQTLSGRRERHYVVGAKCGDSSSPLKRKAFSPENRCMNHTYSHRSFTGYSTGTSPLSYKQRAGELRKTESVVQRIAGASTKRARRPADLSDYHAPRVQGYWRSSWRIYLPCTGVNKGCSW
jgi:hypothetical protein